MTAVVSGANGFCGRAMIAFLAARGIEVLPLTRADFHSPGDGTFLPCGRSLVDRFRERKIDYVFHLVGVSGAAGNSDTFTANVFTAMAIFAALQHNRQKPVVVLAGSAAEYGPVELSDLPIIESRPENPIDAYGLSKTMQTRVGQMAAAAGHRVVLSRPFNIVGAGMPSHLAMGNFLRQFAEARNAPSLVLQTGPLQPQRDFITIEDAVRAWWELANHPAAYGSIVNICSGTPLPIQQIVNWMVSAVQFPVTVQPLLCSGPRASNLVNFGSPNLIRSLLGWGPAALNAETVATITHQHLACSCSD